MKLFILCFMLSPFLSISQTTVVEKIVECRSTADGFYDNRCQITLNIFGDEVRKNQYIRISKIMIAEDDQGLNLIGEEKNSKYAEINGSNTSVEINLLPTSRKAKVIKEMSGEIGLFSPTEANGGIVKVKNLQKSAMQDLLPKIKEVDLLYLTKESVEKFKTENKNKKEAELKKQSKEVQEMANEIFSIFDEFFRWGESKAELNFFVKGEQDKIINIFFEKPNGTIISNNGYMSSGGLITYYFNEDIEANYVLNITVESALAVKKIPFSIKNIELP